MRGIRSYRLGLAAGALGIVCLIVALSIIISGGETVEADTDTEEPEIHLVVVREVQTEGGYLRCDEETLPFETEPREEVSGTLEEHVDPPEVSQTAIVETPETEPVETYEDKPYSRSDVEYIAKTIYGEGDGLGSYMEKAAIVWCILNRVDAEGYGCGHSIEYVVTFPAQFDGYNMYYPVTEENEMIAIDVLERWIAEKNGAENVGRVLPASYLYFVGDGSHNHFSEVWQGTDYWNWSLENPYES